MDQNHIMRIADDVMRSTKHQVAYLLYQAGRKEQKPGCGKAAKNWWHVDPKVEVEALCNREEYEHKRRKRYLNGGHRVAAKQMEWFSNFHITWELQELTNQRQQRQDQRKDQQCITARQSWQLSQASMMCLCSLRRLVPTLRFFVLVQVDNCAGWSSMFVL